MSVLVEAGDEGAAGSDPNPLWLTTGGGAVGAGLGARCVFSVSSIRLVSEAICVCVTVIVCKLDSVCDRVRASN